MIPFSSVPGKERYSAGHSRTWHASMLCVIRRTILGCYAMSKTRQDKLGRRMQRRSQKSTLADPPHSSIWLVQACVTWVKPKLRSNSSRVAAASCQGEEHRKRLCCCFATFLFSSQSHFAWEPPKSLDQTTPVNQPDKPKMDYKEDLDKTGGAGQKTQHKIRITLTSRNVKPLEKCESESYTQSPNIPKDIV